MALKVFISGPITGYENNNRAKFYEAERILRGLGFDVFNPVWMDFTDSWTHEEIMAVDLAALATCDAIYQLDGWEDSKGALEEFYFAIKHSKEFVTLDRYVGLSGAMRRVRVGSPIGLAAEMADGFEFDTPIRRIADIIIKEDHPVGYGLKAESVTIDETAQLYDEAMKIINSGLSKKPDVKVKVLKDEED